MLQKNGIKIMYEEEWFNCQVGVLKVMVCDR